MKVEKQKKKFLSALEDNKKIKLYLIHHMHHFKVGSDVEHELHHCFLFSQKDMKGRKYSIVHKLYKENLVSLRQLADQNKDEIYHCLAEKFEGILYDHINNAFKIVPRKLGSRIIYEVKM